MDLENCQIYDIITRNLHIIDTNKFYNMVENEEEAYEGYNCVSS